MGSTTSSVSSNRCSACWAPFMLRRMHEMHDCAHIFLPPGIGEFLWAYSKLRHVARPICYWFTSDEPRRAHAICELVGADWLYAGSVNTDWILDNFAGEVDARTITRGSFQFMHINRHLEAGRKLIDWMPELPYANPMDAFARYRDPDNSVVVHMCSEAYSEGNLPDKTWAHMIRNIEANYGPVSIVGALWDSSFAMRVMHHYMPHGKIMLGQSLASVAHEIHHAQAFVGLNSGLAIMATYMGVPTIEGYPTWLTALASAWITEDIAGNHHWCYTKDLPNAYGNFLETAFRST